MGSCPQFHPTVQSGIPTLVSHFLIFRIPKVRDSAPATVQCGVDVRIVSGIPSASPTFRKLWPIQDALPEGVRRSPTEIAESRHPSSIRYGSFLPVLGTQQMDSIR